jgi:hypothetical protein
MTSTSIVRLLNIYNGMNLGMWKNFGGCFSSRYCSLTLKCSLFASYAHALSHPRGNSAIEMLAVYPRGLFEIKTVFIN